MDGMCNENPRPARAAAVRPMRDAAPKDGVCRTPSALAEPAASGLELMWSPPQFTDVEVVEKPFVPKVLLDAARKLTPARCGVVRP